MGQQFPFVTAIKRAPREIRTVDNTEGYLGGSLLRATRTDPQRESKDELEELFQAGKNGDSFYGEKSPARVSAYVRGERAHLGLS